MGYNIVVSGHPKSTGIPWVDGLSTGPPNLRCHRSFMLGEEEDATISLLKVDTLRSNLKFH